MSCEEVMVSSLRCSGALPVCSGAWWIGCASGRAGSITRWSLERKERSHVNSQAYRRSVSPRFRASHGLSGRGQTSLRCGRSSRDELVQVIRVHLQGNADECSGRSSQHIYTQYVKVQQILHRPDTQCHGCALDGIQW